MSAHHSPSRSLADDDLCNTLLWDNTIHTNDPMDFGSTLDDLNVSIALDPPNEFITHTSTDSMDPAAHSWEDDQFLSAFSKSPGTKDVDPLATGLSVRNSFEPLSFSNQLGDLSMPTPPLTNGTDSVLMSPLPEPDSFPFFMRSAPTSAPADSRSMNGGLLDCECNCYNQTLKRMYRLNMSRAQSRHMTIDEAMKLEKEVRDEVLDLLRCTICSTNRPRVLLLIGLNLESTVDMLERVLLDDAKSSGHSILDHYDNASQPKRAKVFTSLPHKSKTPLRLGSYEIDGDEKAGFLAYMTRSRIKELSTTMRQLCSVLQKVQQTCNSKAAISIVVATFQRLQAIMGQLDR